MRTWRRRWRRRASTSRRSTIPARGSPRSRSRRSRRPRGSSPTTNCSASARPPVPRGTFRSVCLSLIHRPDLGSALERMADVTARCRCHRSRLIRSERSTRLEVRVDVRDDAYSPELSSSTRRSGWSPIFELILLHRFAAWLVGRRVRLRAVLIPLSGARGPVRQALRRDLRGSRSRSGRPWRRSSSTTRSCGHRFIQDEDTLAEYLRESLRTCFSPNATTTAPPPLRCAGYSRWGRADARALPTRSPRCSSISVPAPAPAPAPGRHVAQRAARGVCCATPRSPHYPPRRAVDELSARLGFSEASAFRRAFKRWTGATPGPTAERSAGTPPPPPWRGAAP